MADATSSGLGFFGAWQVGYLILATGVDADWNKTPLWPAFSLTEMSLFFPTILAVTIAVAALIVGGILAVILK
ncbi:hypothetical protein JRC04_05510 [Mycolicibacterium sp. S2-37]|uniref:hypothetical protein n=1 Tax=Mycolicibacterium sp. S2-37 TaxID=2810297 RepID=UPI001A94384E|nr:hypothetical protein [Mycolicibacterium sp. S2-37]MBO0676913.1 hypothetical protein [Mycolicibacterium sp. S2-37]